MPRPLEQVHWQQTMNDKDRILLVFIPLSLHARIH